MLTFLNPEALKRYTERMDTIDRHMKEHWEGKEEVKVHPAARIFTFELACNLFASIDDPAQISKLAALFTVFKEGLFDFPINMPGKRFYSFMKAASAIKEDLKLIARERKEALDKKLVSPTQDLLSLLLVTADTSGRFLSETEIVDNILALLFAGHDTSRSARTLLMKCLGELPEVYAKVLKEQTEIAKCKEPGQMLQWEHIQKMKYSWNVASEIMRLSPPVNGAFREALVDFFLSGLHDPKRMEGGPRMCLGHEFARLEILVFLHNVVTRFKWDLLIPDEKFRQEPTLTPTQELPIRLHPHQS
ncbi:cytochrome P450, putative [Ricinus communis]|uniref:Cytochrome P450, putative n=1 Tax=Ricinus communis TaxID=3988 RepID=B9S060_RICCO|nr:cytochrome P450, putative [Ricinus communis]